MVNIYKMWFLIHSDQSSELLLAFPTFLLSFLLVFGKRKDGLGYLFLTLFLGIINKHVCCSEVLVSTKEKVMTSQHFHIVTLKCIIVSIWKNVLIQCPLMINLLLVHKAIYGYNF